ncbi:retron-type reverse transcriptase [Fontibacillus solani]|uniref:Retron-type reverse transcriptase n=2 Tax=Fontibacillus solani TaxID=1572857 RepID=A0A7W3XSY8_9BACL|nr:retron-type reverse transcriptase [Fontibacillus solani]
MQEHGASTLGMAEKETVQELAGELLDSDNLNRAYKQVKRNHGAPGIDGMIVEEALPWLREHRDKLLQSIQEGKYKTSPVWRKKLPNHMEAEYVNSEFQR